jgi:UDP-glucose:(heptosyl)LPS alpha-1,3-glucosyltransferase
MTEKKMVIIRSVYSPYGGVETHALNLIRKLLEHHIDIHLLTCSNQHWPIEHPRLTIVELGHNHSNRLYQAWTFNKAVKKFLNTNNFNCVLSMDQVDTCTHIHAGGGSHKFFLKIKNQNSSAIKQFAQKFSLFHRYILSLEKKAFTDYQLKKIRCCSQMIQKDILQFYDIPIEKFIVVYNSIDWKEIGIAFAQRNILKEKFLKKHGFQKDWNMLLFLGSGFKRKGLDIAIKGLKYLDDSFHLLVIGKGSNKYYQHLAKSLGVDKRVHLIGPQKNGWQYSAICKGVVLLSLYEPFGRAVAEAQAMGLPALVSDRTGYSELIQEGKNGFILQSPINEQKIKDIFKNFENLINHPVMTPEQLRNHVEKLDDECIVQQLIHEFLCF